jgi:hypothetical protein
MIEGREESQQLDPIQIQGTITDSRGYTHRTSNKKMQTTKINDDEGDSFRITTQDRDTDNELIGQLETKIKKQENPNK